MISRSLSPPGLRLRNPLHQGAQSLTSTGITALGRQELPPLDHRVAGTLAEGQQVIAGCQEEPLGVIVDIVVGTQSGRIRDQVLVGPIGAYQRARASAGRRPFDPLFRQHRKAAAHRARDTVHPARPKPPVHPPQELTQARNGILGEVAEKAADGQQAMRRGETGLIRLEHGQGQSTVPEEEPVPQSRPLAVLEGGGEARQVVTGEARRATRQEAAPHHPVVLGEGASRRGVQRLHGSARRLDRHLGAERSREIPQETRRKGVLRPEGLEERLTGDPDEEALLRDPRGGRARDLVQERQLAEGLPFAHDGHDLRDASHLPGQLHRPAHDDVEAVTVVALPEQRRPRVFDHGLGDVLDPRQIGVGKPAEELDVAQRRGDVRPRLLNHEVRDLL